MIIVLIISLIIKVSIGCQLICLEKLGWVARLLCRFSAVILQKYATGGSMIKWKKNLLITNPYNLLKDWGQLILVTRRQIKHTETWTVQEMYLLVGCLWYFLNDNLDLFSQSHEKALEILNKLLSQVRLQLHPFNFITSLLEYLEVICFYISSVDRFLSQSWVLLLWTWLRGKKTRIIIRFWETAQLPLP